MKEKRKYWPDFVSAVISGTALRQQSEKEMAEKDAANRVHHDERHDAIIAQRDDAKMGRIGEHQIAVRWPGRLA